MATRTKAKAVKAKAKAKAKAKGTAARVKTAARKLATKKVSFVPKGMPVVTAGFVVPNCRKAVDWLTSTLGMKIKDIYEMPDGGVAHCELRLGDSVVFCGEAGQGTGPYNIHAMIYVKDCDALFDKALAAGATTVRPLTDQFYGDRSGTMKDPFGNEWTIATHKEDVSKKEMERRMAAMMQQAA